jgi:hypothetical protein
MKFLNSKTHSAVDYIVVIFLWLSPTLFNLSYPTSMLVYLLGAVHLALTIFTNFHFGLVKIIPLRWHGWVELGVAIVLMASPSLLGNYVSFGSLIDKYFLAGFGVAVLITWAVTDYSTEPK